MLYHLMSWKRTLVNQVYPSFISFMGCPYNPWAKALWMTHGAKRVPCARSDHLSFGSGKTRFTEKQETNHRLTAAQMVQLWPFISYNWL